MTKLTNRQAIGVLDGLWSNPLFGEAHRQAFEIGIKAIKALEQEPVLDKIRDEILDNAFLVVNPKNTYEFISAIDLDDIDKILDKYKGTIRNDD